MTIARSIARPIASPIASRTPIIGGGGGGISGFVSANDTSVFEGDPVVLTFTDTSIAGSVSASSTSVFEGDPVVLEFLEVANEYQWIDASGDDIVGQTTDETTWNAVIGVNPPRIRVTNPVSGQSKVFSPPTITVAEAPWNPLDLGSDLAVWLQPTFGLFQERTGSSATTASGADGVVGTWRARNGTINGTAPADGQRPIYRATGLNGTPGVQFDGSDDWLNFTTDLAAVLRNKPYGYIWIVSTPVRESTSRAMINFSNNASSGSARAAITANNSNVAGNLAGAGRRLDGNSFQSALATNAFTNAQPVVIGAEFLWSDAQLHVRVNGARVASNNSFQTAGSTSDTNSLFVALGAASDAGLSPFNGHIGNVVVATPASAFSSGQIEEIETFLATSGGITL